MYRMAMLAMTMDPVPNCNMDHVMKLCLAHDLAETRVGDITPYCGVTSEEKHKREVEAMKQISSFLPNHSSEMLVRLFDEYENQETIEAKITKDLDIFDMIQQAFEYEKAAVRDNWTELPDLDEFFNHTTRIQSPQVQEWCSQLLKEREEFKVSSSQS